MVGGMAAEGLPADYLKIPDERAFGGDFRTFQDRCGGLSGIFLFRQWRKWYLAEPGTVTLPWWNKHGVRTMHRHRLNMRVCDAHEEDIADGIEQTGVMPLMRGAPVAVKTELSDRWDMAGAGSMSSAFYIAKARSPENPCVLATEENGLEGCIVVIMRIPDDALEWVCDESNAWHVGADTTFMQFYEMVPKVDEE